MSFLKAQGMLAAARAFLFERSGEIAKSHKRVRAEFGRLTKNDPRFDPELRAFLGRTYDLKAIADYETGLDSKVSAERAGAAIQTARRKTAKAAAFLPF